MQLFIIRNLFKFLLSLPYSAKWAARQSDLCHAYWQRIEGDREQNMEQAIQHGQAALQIYTYEDTPDEWAEALLYIGTAYLSRISGEYRVNIESAINSFEQALRVYTHESEPFDRTRVQAFLSHAYTLRFEGQKGHNEALSIQCAQNALQVYTEENDPKRWGALQIFLGMAYHKRIKQIKDGNAAKAENHYMMGLRVTASDDFFKKLLYNCNWGRSTICRQNMGVRQSTKPEHKLVSMLHWRFSHMKRLLFTGPEENYFEEAVIRLCHLIKSPHRQTSTWPQPVCTRH